MRGIKPERGRRAYPDRVASRRVRDGVSAVVGGDQAGGVVPRIDAQALARLIEVCVDSVLGNAEAAGDFLRAEVLIDQPETFPLSRGQQNGRRVAF